MRPLLLCLALLLCDCTAQSRVDFSTRPFQVTAASYKDVVTRWTRKKEHYEDAESRFFVTATYRSWELREAMLARTARDYSMSALDIEKLREQERKEFETSHEFFVKIYAQPRWFADLNNTTTPWTISLLDNEGHSVNLKPTDITKISDGLRRLDAKTRSLYPYCDDYSMHYVIRFPKTLEDGTQITPVGTSGRLSLRFSGAIQRIELNWLSN
jgi:hypothetical protein